jgi:hypothetical protein
MARFDWFAYRMDLARIAGRSGIADVTEECARAVRRRIARHNRIQENRCNRELTERESAEEIGVETRLRDFFGADYVSFEGDPRGQTVKLRAWEAGNPRFDAHVAEWGLTDARLTYFSHDWGRNLIYTGP